MTPVEINTLAGTAIMDRLRGSTVAPGAKRGRVRIVRVLTPTDAELRWQAFVGRGAAPGQHCVIPAAILRLAREARRARTT